MKYMGSKRAMLGNGLGEILQLELAGKRRFADLFTGSGAVAWWVAGSHPVEVIASDIQRYACALAAAVVLRVETFDPSQVWLDWLARAHARFSESALFNAAQDFDARDWTQAPYESSRRARELCSVSDAPSLCQAYGGFYFSPAQSLWIDSLRHTLPETEALRVVALASLIIACSECAAAPGHTAQPFAPTLTASKYLFECWRRDIVERTQRSFQALAHLHALKKGETLVDDAERIAEGLAENDLAFVDPPYSGVQYSRFYHVLEGVEVGEVRQFSGTGRYPDRSDRPQSDYSLKSRSHDALSSLLQTLAARGVSTVLTFPAETASNGLSGEVVESIAQTYFPVSRRTVNGRFSTLGGNAKIRRARIPAYELILTLNPK